MKSFLLIVSQTWQGAASFMKRPSIYNERIEMLCNGRWQMMTEPINYDRPVAAHWRRPCRSLPVPHESDEKIAWIVRKAEAPSMNGTRSTVPPRKQAKICGGEQ